MGQDVNVLLPPMVAGVRDLESVRIHSPADYTAALEERIAQLVLERQQDKLALKTFTNCLASFVKAASEQNGTGLEVMIAREVSDRMEGANVTVSEVPGTRDVIVRVRERAPHPLWEGPHG